MDLNSSLRIGFYSLEMSNTFNETLYRGVKDGCQELGINLTVIHGGQIRGPHNFEHVRNRLYSDLKTHSLDGLLLGNIFNFTSDAEREIFLDTLQGVPLVTLGFKTPQHPALLIDNRKGFLDLMTHLIVEKGCKNLGAITGPRGNEDTQERLQAFLDALRQHELSFDPQYLFEGTYSHTSGRLGVVELMENRKLPLDALVCFNDNMALGAIRELQNRGIRVPEDLILTGFDNTDESRALTPDLTTVHFPMYELGKQGLQRLAKILRKEPLPLHDHLQTHFLPRRSSGYTPNGTSLWETALAGNLKGLGAPKDFLVQDDFHPPGHLLEVLMEEYQGRVQSPITSSHLTTTKVFIKQLLWQAFKSLNTSSREHFLEQLRQHMVLASGKGWDITLWPELLTQMGRVFYHLAPPSHRPYFQQLFSDALSLALDNTRNAQLSLKIFERKLTETLLEIGERIGTSHESGQIKSQLIQSLPELGFQFCRIILLEGSPESPSARIYFQYGGQKHTEAPAELASLIGEIETSAPPGLFVDLLHTQDSVLGYVFYDLPQRPGLIFKTLRHQISASIHTSRLVEKINEYATSLESRIAERTRELQEEIQQREMITSELLKQKNLESLGLLAGGIAHDFNNLLTGILGNVSLLQLGSLPQQEETQCLSDMELACDRAKGLTHQLLTFSQGGAPVKSRVSLKKLLEETVHFTMTGSAVKTTIQIAANLWDADADKGQISQVFQNLTLNALQAMPSGGNLFITAKNADPQEHPSDLSAGEYIQVQIRDEGMGILPEHLSKIFYPYYTTKADGNGLGLSTSRAIIKRHGGSIQIESQPRHGTLVTLWIPRSKEAWSESSTAVPIRAQKNLRILVLEDQEILLNLVLKMFKKLDHQVHATKEGQETLKEFERALKKGTPYDLLLLDLTVPGGWGGLEVVKALKEKSYNYYAVACSGYAEGSVMAVPQDHGFHGVLKKPYGIKELEGLLAQHFPE